MKYTTELEINIPREKVIELFDNPDNMKKWQPGLISFEHVSGTAGQAGAKSKLKYVMGKREIEMIETITVRNLPDEFSGTYVAKGVLNIINNYFIETSTGKTIWKVESDFQFKGFMILMNLMPGMFKKQTIKFMNDFKKFAEENA